MGLQADQDGVISRQQLLASGEFEDEASLVTTVRRRVRRKEWARVLPGVFVDHTGPLTWRQRAWAAVLFYEPAALAGPSALHAWGVRGYEPKDSDPIYVCIDRSRGVKRRVGIHVRQVVRMETLCVMGAGIPRERVEHALIDVASAERGLDDCVAKLADAVQDRRTTAPRLVEALGVRTRLRQRAVMLEVLTEIGAGVRSALEHRYRVEVERAHGLPTALRQAPVMVGGHRTERDASYDEFGVVVELDGRVAHELSETRWADADRDIAAAISGQITIRPGWRHVLEPCRLAQSVADLLTSRGWTGQLVRCGADCATSESPGGLKVAQSS